MAENFAFGPFQLLAARRELLAHGVPVTLGQRAFEILLMLVNRHGQLVTKDELMAEVWPGVVVEENNIQVHVSALRKVLSTAGDGDGYLLPVAGRGYRFVARVQRESGAVLRAPPASAPDRTAAVSAGAATNNLPQQLTTLIGREADLANITARLGAHRLVTLTGSGGVGKTRLAIEAGRNVLDRYPDGVWLAELAPLNDPQLVTSIVGDVLGVSLNAPRGAIETLASALKDKQLLLILDNCEHVIAEGARVAETLMRSCPRLSILASSRERLAIAGESIVRVPSLPAPNSQRSRWAICCCRWSRKPWCMQIRPAASFATACSNRPATMRSKSSPMLCACAGGTPSTSPRGSHKRRRSGRRPRRGSGWHAMPPTSTTCAARWNGLSERAATSRSGSSWWRAATCCGPNSA